MIEGEMRGAKSGGGVTLLRWILTETVARSLNSGKLLRQPGGTIWRGTKGEMERRQGATYTHSERSKREGIKAGLKRGRNYWEETVVGVDFGQRLEMTGGSHLSARGREKRVYRFGVASWAAGSFLVLGRFVAPGPFLFFHFSSSFLFLFSYSFHIFCKFDSIQAKPTL
jgi:hypothetical protein